MIALIVVALGAVIAAVGTGMLAARASRRPRIYVVAWAVALFGLAVGLGATTLGYIAGYDSLMFRAMELGAQVIAPLALCVALVEVTGRRLASRFGMRLAVSGIAVVALVILGTDPISPNETFTSKWPDPAFYYQIAPLTVLGFLTLFTAMTAAASLVVMLVRSSREQLPTEETRPGMLVALAGLAVALPGLVWLVAKFGGLSLPLPEKDVFAAGCSAAAGLVWYAARMAGNRDLGQAPIETAASSSRDDWEYDESGPRERIGSDRAGSHSYPDDRYPDGPYPDDSYPDLPRAGRYEDSDSEYRYPGLAALIDSPEPADEPVYGADSWPPGDQYHLDSRGEDPQAQLFGQITIYTLIEAAAADFDRLTEWVVAQVQAREPDTLVYIVHAVPTAPMQRILYEVYRDRAAYHEHLSRSYVMTYEAEQRPLVLAANVIELGLQQAKVSPLPSISAFSDILAESGIDLTGITRSSHDGRRDGADEFGEPGYDRPYSGWAEIRGEDSRY